MATYNLEVSTWSELVDALTRVDAGGDVFNIRLVSDIDCNFEIPLGVVSTIDIPSGTRVLSGAYQENGVTKNHVIRNLRTHVTNPVAIFMYNPGSSHGGSLSVKNIDFINLVTESRLFQFSYFSSRNVAFSDCRFVGRRTSNLFKGGNSNTGYLTFTSCFFNVPIASLTSTQTDDDKDTLSIVSGMFGNTNYSKCNANFCWIRCTYKGWSVSTSYANELRTFHLNGCYIDGTIVGDDGIRLRYYTYNSSIQNVVDADLKLITGAATPDIGMPKGVWKNYVTNRDDPSVVYTTNNLNTQYGIPATPAQMKDTQWLYDHGFDVVV
jgi:hypothetical protein